MPNPYDPQTPARPEYFGGREAVLQSVQERINIARVHNKSGGILIYGHRGVGKTSLLQKIVSEVRGDEEHPSNVLVISRRLSRTTSDSELYMILNEELLDQVRFRHSLIKRIGMAARQVKSFKAFEVVEISVQENTKAKSAYMMWKSTLRGLRNADFVLIAVDDADFLSIEAIGELKTIVEESQGVPVLLAISGGIGFEEKIVDKYSPVSRIFYNASFNIGKFTIEETREVLLKPLKNEKTKWEEQAIKELHKLTAGYPYLVQCLASASYMEDGTIDQELVKNAVPKAVRIGRSWLDHEIPNASDQDIISFEKIAQLNKETFQSVEIGRQGVSPPYIGRLVKLGVLKQVSRGRYSLQKSPMIATYEVSKRGLRK